MSLPYGYDFVRSGGGAAAVTSVQVSGGETGLTTSGGPVTSTGTITFQGTLETVSGGTGLSAVGSVGQMLQVASGGSALEYTTPSKMSFSLAGQNGSSQTVNNSDTVLVTGATNETTGLVTSTTASAPDTLSVEVSGGTLNQANGGTGMDLSSKAAGTLIIGTGTGLTTGTLTSGDNISISNEPAGSITITAIATGSDISMMKPLYYDTINHTFHFEEDGK
jgi:hypothetical protein